MDGGLSVRNSLEGKLFGPDSKVPTEQESKHAMAGDKARPIDGKSKASRFFKFIRIERIQVGCQDTRLWNDPASPNVGLPLSQ
jgi:hypothetical protein